MPVQFVAGDISDPNYMPYKRSGSKFWDEVLGGGQNKFTADRLNQQYKLNQLQEQLRNKYNIDLEATRSNNALVEKYVGKLLTDDTAMKSFIATNYNLAPTDENVAMYRQELKNLAGHLQKVTPNLITSSVQSKLSGAKQNIAESDLAADTAGMKLGWQQNPAHRAELENQYRAAYEAQTQGDIAKREKALNDQALAPLEASRRTQELESQMRVSPFEERASIAKANSAEEAAKIAQEFERPRAIWENASRAGNAALAGTFPTSYYGGMSQIKAPGEPVNVIKAPQKPPITLNQLIGSGDESGGFNTGTKPVDLRSKYGGREVDSLSLQEVQEILAHPDTVKILDPRYISELLRRYEAFITGGIK